MTARILIIDDEEIIHESIRMILEDEGYEIISAMNGVEGLEFFNAHSPMVVFLDLKMPGMDGMAFLKKVEAGSCADCSFIAITAHGTQADLDNMAALGVKFFIGKPFDIDKLRTIVRSCIA